MELFIEKCGIKGIKGINRINREREWIRLCIVYWIEGIVRLILLQNTPRKIFSQIKYRNRVFLPCYSLLPIFKFSFQRSKLTINFSR